ncbi:MAG: flagellar FlbD family protein [Calditrichia bacterium]
MILCKKINGSDIYINAELIEFIESTPDTIISTTTGKKIIVSDSVEDVIARIIEYKRRIFDGAIIKLQGTANEEDNS